MASQIWPRCSRFEPNYAGVTCSTLKRSCRSFRREVVAGLVVACIGIAVLGYGWQARTVWAPGDQWMVVPADRRPRSRRSSAPRWRRHGDRVAWIAIGASCAMTAASFALLLWQSTFGLAQRGRARQHHARPRSNAGRTCAAGDDRRPFTDPRSLPRGRSQHRCPGDGLGHVGCRHRAGGDRLAARFDRPAAVVQPARL